MINGHPQEEFLAPTNATRVFRPVVTLHISQTESSVRIHRGAAWSEDTQGPPPEGLEHTFEYPLQKPARVKKCSQCTELEAFARWQGNELFVELSMDGVIDGEERWIVDQQGKRLTIRHSPKRDTEMCFSFVPSPSPLHVAPDGCKPVKLISEEEIFVRK